MHLARRVRRPGARCDAAGQRTHRRRAAGPARRRVPVRLRHEHGARPAARHGRERRNRSSRGAPRRHAHAHIQSRDRRPRRGTPGERGAYQGDQASDQARGRRHHTDAAGVRADDGGARQPRSGADVADEPVAASRAHHARHVLLRGADPPRRLAGADPPRPGYELPGVARHYRGLPVQPRAVRGLVRVPRGVARTVLRVGRRGDHARAGRPSAGDEGARRHRQGRAIADQAAPAHRAYARTPCRSDPRNQPGFGSRQRRRRARLARPGQLA